jgi:hypothetical protein
MFEFPKDDKRQLNYITSMCLRFVTARDLRQTFLFPISSVLTSLLIGFEKSNKVGSVSGFKINFFILYPMEEKNSIF